MLPGRDLETPQDAANFPNFTSAFNANIPPNDPVKRKLGFLDLPAELRNSIYNYALAAASQDQNHLTENWTLSNPIFLHHLTAQSRGYGIGLLSTCKTVHQEATPIFFSQNTFVVQAADQALLFLHTIGPRTTSFIECLRLVVPYQSNILAWMQLLELLRTKATGLKELHVGWGTSVTNPLSLVPLSEGRGYGDNVDFVHALARIHGLTELLLEGWFAKNWPAYLQKETGARIRVRAGFTGPALLLSRDAAVPELPGPAGMDYPDAISFIQYQQGTEDLFP